MWLFIIEIILFYSWPTLAAVGFWLGWKRQGRIAYKQIAIALLFLQFVWLFIIFYESIA